MTGRGYGTARHWTNRAGLPVAWYDMPPTTFKEIFLSMVAHADFSVLVCDGCQTVQRATPAEAEKHAQNCYKTPEGS